MNGTEQGRSLNDTETSAVPGFGALASERRLVAIILLAGLALRFAWLWRWALKNAVHDNKIWPIEPVRVATELAASGRFADAFAAGSGPTAHLSPLMPWLISLVYGVCGSGSLASDLLLSAIAIGLVVLSFGLGYRLARALGVPAWARLGALAFVALVPIQLPLEINELRGWEAPLVVVVMMAVLLAAVRLETDAPVSWRTVARFSLPAALMALASPPAALTIGVIAAILAWRRVPARQWPALGAVMVLVPVLTLLPWALRNEMVMGRMIWTRSNAGLELALAYNDTILKTADERIGYRSRMAEIHPLDPSGRGFALLRAAGGEAAYYDGLGTQTRQWIADHPVDAATLVLRHVRQYVLPPDWFFNTWGKPRAAAAPGIRRALLAALTVVALLGLPGLIARDRRYLYPAVTILLLTLPYIVVQPILRYHYLNSTLLAFMAFATLAWLVELVRARRQPAAAYMAEMPPST